MANRDPGALGIILEKLSGQELLIAKRQDPFLRTHRSLEIGLEGIEHKLNDKVRESEKDKLFIKITT